MLVSIPVMTYSCSARRQHLDERVVSSARERLSSAASGYREQILDEVDRQGRRLHLDRRVPVQVVGVRLRMVVLGLQAGEQVRFSTLGRLIGNAVPVRLGEVVAKSFVAHLQHLAG